MQRLRYCVNLTLWAAGAFIVMFLIPEEAQAHVSIQDAPDEVASETDSPKGHCHGEIECVVTLFPVNLEESALGFHPNPEHFAARDMTLEASETARDPPVPILW